MYDLSRAQANENPNAFIAIEAIKLFLPVVNVFEIFFE